MSEIERRSVEEERSEEADESAAGSPSGGPGVEPASDNKRQWAPLLLMLLPVLLAVVFGILSEP